MKGMLAVLAAVAFVAGSWCGAADVENPYKKAKVGDWVAYSITTMGQAQTMKQTVKAKDEKEITLIIEMEVMGQKVKQETKIPLDQPYDPVKAGSQPDAKVEKVADGKETVTVAGKEYACQWYQVKMSMKAPTGDMAGTGKSWICPDVPLSGLVKSEQDVEFNAGGQPMKMHMTMELKDCGQGQ
jgi:hypothetical protein